MSKGGCSTEPTAADRSKPPVQLFKESVSYETLTFQYGVAPIEFNMLADDGMLQIRNISKTPDLDTEHASLQMMWFNVPVQATSDGIESIIYAPVIEAVGDFVLERDYARPLIAFYADGHVDMIPEEAGGFYGHGERDMYAALSLDDGDTWKRDNVSRSTDKKTRIRRSTCVSLGTVG